MSNFKVQRPTKKRMKGFEDQFKIKFKDDSGKGGRVREIARKDFYISVDTVWYKKSLHFPRFFYGDKVLRSRVANCMKLLHSGKVRSSFFGDYCRQYSSYRVVAIIKDKYNLKDGKAERSRCLRVKERRKFVWKCTKETLWSARGEYFKILRQKELLRKKEEARRERLRKQEEARKELLRRKKEMLRKKKEAWKKFDSCLKSAKTEATANTCQQHLVILKK